MRQGNSKGTASRRRPGTRHVVAVVLVATAVLGACGSEDDGADEPVAEAADDAASTLPPYGLVTPEQAVSIAASDVTVIDVRTADEFAAGHLDGAVQMDFYDPAFAERVGELDPDGEYLVYCRSDNRSGQAVALMREMGIEQVWDMDGGIVAYSAAGLPLVD
jgi:phage shock protein E